MSLRPFFHENKVEVGLDEVGRGCLAGPVVTAAVILPKDFDFPIVKDSKKLSEKKRKEAFELIKEKAIDYSISFIPPQTIDKINILQATMEGMHTCLNTLESNFNHILVDGNYFVPYKEIPHDCVIKGDTIRPRVILKNVGRVPILTFNINCIS